MDLRAEHFEELLERFVAWAHGQEKIRSAILVGSRARKEHPADASSDMDIIIFSTDPQSYLSSTDWLEQIDHFCLTFIEPTGNGRFMERRVLFAGGYDVDFPFLPTEILHQELQTGLSSELGSVLSRGARVVLDKDGLAERMLAELPQLPALQPPSQDEFLNLVNDFWYHAVWTAKKLARGELWTAKGCSDNYMKWRLMRMIEWSTRAKNGWEYDTWHDGRFLERWADPQVIAELPATYAAYELDDLWRGLIASMDLFQRLALETSQSLGYPYPHRGEQCARQIIAEIRP